MTGVKFDTTTSSLTGLAGLLACLDPLFRLFGAQPFPPTSRYAPVRQMAVGQSQVLQGSCYDAVFSQEKNNLSKAFKGSLTKHIA